MAFCGQQGNIGGRYERHVVLVAPEVHWNTGNIGRTCLGAGAHLHLVRPLGFRLDDKHLRRAGLDYWPKVNPMIWEDFKAFVEAMQPESGQMVFFTKAASRSFWNMPCPARLFLVFGSETRGLPREICDRYAEWTYRIPITEQIRSLNLSTAVGIALYESLRPLQVISSFEGTLSM